MAPRRDLLEACSLAMEWLGDLPPILRDDPDLQAIYYCYAMEAARKQARIEDVRVQLNPLTATTNIGNWEALLHLPTSPGPIDARQQAVAARIRALSANPSGADWALRITSRLGANVAWSYVEHDATDPTSPPAQTIRISLPYSAASPQFSRARAVIREETASELAVTYDAASSGFLLDISHMDTDVFGA